MKNFVETNIQGVYEIDFFHLKDDRGVFVKPYHKATLDKLGLDSEFQESFYSINQKGVIRGMHFQNPPEDHSKIVYCTTGKLIDVILDIRKKSPTYGQWAEVELSENNFKGVYMPKGVAHGFSVMEDNTCMIYLTSTMHSPANDNGIRWDSFGYYWPFKNPIISERDRSFCRLNEIESPF